MRLKSLLEYYIHFSECLVSKRLEVAQTRERIFHVEDRIFRGKLSLKVKNEDSIRLKIVESWNSFPTVSSLDYDIYGNSYFLTYITYKIELGQKNILSITYCTSNIS